MLTKIELGKAIRIALDAKRDKQTTSYAQIAREVFEVKPESLQGWMKTGAISKPNFEKLKRYTADVVGPGHWGTEDDIPPVSAAQNSRPRPLVRRVCDIAETINDIGLKKLLVLAEDMARLYPVDPVPNKKPVRKAKAA